MPPDQPLFIKGERGIKIQVLAEGEGVDAQSGDTVLIDFVLRRSDGYFIYSTVEGVSFQPRDVPVGPVAFELGSGQLVPGLEEVSRHSKSISFAGFAGGPVSALTRLHLTAGSNNALALWAAGTCRDEEGRQEASAHPGRGSIPRAGGRPTAAADVQCQEAAGCTPERALPFRDPAFAHQQAAVTTTAPHGCLPDIT